MNPFEDLKVMKNVDGDEIRFVKLIRDDLIQVWQKDNDSYVSKGIRLLNHSIDIDELKSAGVFSLLNPIIQAEMGMSKVRVKEEVKEKMAVIREKRVKKYANLPVELVCACGNKTTPNYSILQKRADKLMIPLIDMVKNYQCQVCKPSKGRPRKDKGNLPAELTCACGYKTKANYSFIGKKAKEFGITVEEYCKNYRCQLCNPTKGKGKRVGRPRKVKV